ncbi:hypothetical protein RCO48_10195 [Peribacillus frigoritolerans]|nr:hypothetical protein [Peribacillus frigoritolerans]
MPNSSLARYLGLGMREFGTKDSHYLLNEVELIWTACWSTLRMRKKLGSLMPF